MDIMLEVKQLRRMNAAFALPLINALPDTNVLESNRKTAYQVYLTAAAQGTTHLTSAQFDLISDIAHQCPLEGGSGVFLARALYQYNDRKHFDDMVICDTEIERAQTSVKKSATHEIDLVPNPTANMVDLMLANDMKGREITVRLANIAGQEVLVRSGTFDTGIIHLDVSGLPSGMYFCTTNIAGQPRQTAKLSIQR